ncbi:MAG TPA: hypothetical protein VK858_20960 [Longimicrobiales bacterium]|nr:hypothetical protein [Longimicrobiales bacterium]
MRSGCGMMLLAGLAVVGAGPLNGQDRDGVDRLWAEVETVGGDVLEGFVRWDRNEVGWGDLLDGDKAVPRETYLMWARATGDGEVEQRRSVEFMGFTVSWNEDDPRFPSLAQSGIRFGHLDRLVVLDDQRVELRLRSGEIVQLQGGSTDLGTDMRELLVEVPGEETVELEWDDVDEIRFGPAPAGVSPREPRLHGTVEDRWGNRYTGALSWDLDEALASDILDGEEDGRDREIPFREIAGIERDWDGARVLLTDGQELVLSGSNDVDDGHRGVQISDPGLGMVVVEWDEFDSVRFHPPEAPTGWADFDGGHRLEGTVITRGGDELTGWIRWDADEEWSWELLNGEQRDVVFHVEFGRIDRIERGSSRSAVVTLLDGRTFELEGSNDVDRDNKGIFVAVSGSRTGPDAPDAEWIRIDWDEFQELRFHHGN